MINLDDRISEIRQEKSRINSEIDSIKKAVRQIDKEMQPLVKQKKQISEQLKKILDQEATLIEQEATLIERKNIYSRLIEIGCDQALLDMVSENSLPELKRKLAEFEERQKNLRQEEEKNSKDLRSFLANNLKEPFKKKKKELSKKMNTLEKDIAYLKQQIDIVGNYNYKDCDDQVSNLTKYKHQKEEQLAKLREQFKQLE